MIVDIFTHENAPEKPNFIDGVCESAFHYNERNNLYLSRIKQKASESEFAIWLPLSDKEGWLNGLILRSQKLSCYIEGKGVFGCVDREHELVYRELLGKIKPNDQIRLHGAFFGICVSETAVQAYYLMQGHFLHPADADYNAKFREVREGNLLTTTNISYGIVYMPPRSLKPEELQITRQLQREHTEVFESR